MFDQFGRFGRYLRDQDAKVAARAGRDAEMANYQIAAERAKRIEGRTKEIAGRSQQEKADMLGAALGDARRMQSADIASSPINLKDVMRSAGLPLTGSRKGNLQAPELSEEQLRAVVGGMSDGGQAMGAAFARGEGPGFNELRLRAQQAMAQNMAAAGTRGQISRGLAYAGITGGITASGAALIDLMSYFSQGTKVEGEREEVLSS